MESFSLINLQNSLNSLHNTGGRMHHHMLSTSSLVLPPELDVKPWFSSCFQPTKISSTTNDVVLLGEFSEIEGPVPLVTIPEMTKSNFDINEFIVKLMSVDYQNISVGEFQICEDTQLMQLDIEKGYHAYVHYFTLYDERARGFVRPMCLAYISLDARKLQKYFLQIQIEFKLASNYLKSCNLQIFRDEMNARICDLHYTKHRYIIANRDLQNDPPEMPTTAKVFKKRDNNNQGRAFFEKSGYFDHEFVTARRTGNEHLTKKSSTIRDDLKEKYYLSTYHNTTEVNSGSSSSAANANNSAPYNQDHMKQSLVVTETKTKDLKVAARVTTGTIAHLNLEEELNLLHHTSLEAIAYQLLDCQHILSVIREQMEEDAVRNDIEMLNNAIIKEPTSYLATSMKLLDIEHAHLDSVKGHTPSVFVMSTMKRTFQDMRMIREITDLGYIACLCKLLDIHSTYSRPFMTLMFDSLDKPLSDCSLQSLHIGSIPVIGINPVVNINKHPSGKSLLNSVLQYNDRLMNLFFSSSRKSSYNNDECPSTEKQEDLEAKVISESDSDVDSSIMHTSQDFSMKPMNNKDSNVVIELDVDKITSYLDIDDRIFVSKACHLSGLIQQFRGVSHCLIHSLLSGRPVILAAPEHLKSLVVMYTNALTKVLPYHRGKELPVVGWHTGTVTEHHLHMYKVMGVCIPERLHIQDLMSNATLNQVTVLNIETGHISGIAYSGNLLNGLEQFSQRQFHSDPPLQVALQAILVTLGLKVYLLFYLKQTTDKTTSQILKGLGIAKGDWGIINYLVSIIKQQRYSNVFT